MAFAQQLQQPHPQSGPSGASTVATNTFLDLIPQPFQCPLSKSNGSMANNIVSNGTNSPSRHLLSRSSNQSPSRVEFLPAGPSGFSPHHQTGQQLTFSTNDGGSPTCHFSPTSKGYRSYGAINSIEEVTWRMTSKGTTYDDNGRQFGSPKRSVANHGGTVTERIWAKSAATKTKHREPLADRAGVVTMSSLASRPATPPVTLGTIPAASPLPSMASPSDLWSPGSSSSCEDNLVVSALPHHLLGSPTEFNSCSQLTEKPQMVKTFESSWTTGISGLESSPNRLAPIMVSLNSPAKTKPNPNSRVAKDLANDLLPPRPGSGGYVNEGSNRSEDGDGDLGLLEEGSDCATLCLRRDSTERLLCSSPTARSSNNSTSKRLSQSSTSNSESSCAINSTSSDDQSLGKRMSGCSSRNSVGYPPPPLPERHDSLNSQDEESEIKELRDAPWFQAGIPREIALEILAQEPVGSFMVRESTSKPGCFALSLRVPRDFQPTGIAHYLIMRTQKGFKIKGFLKEFTTLKALITHHSVMAELLPCPLSLSRYNPAYRKQSSSQDMVDIEDPDYNLLSDFRKVMADLKV